tara:strand:+ start:72 stop:245 length:174 start_codon:yes stop_codon:yes gene_type:complete
MRCSDDYATFVWIRRKDALSGGSFVIDQSNVNEDRYSTNQKQIKQNEAEKQSFGFKE